jgi:hypothetical protein
LVSLLLQTAPLQQSRPAHDGFNCTLERNRYNGHLKQNKKVAATNEASNDGRRPNQRGLQLRTTKATHPYAGIEEQATIAALSSKQHRRPSRPTINSQQNNLRRAQRPQLHLRKK